MNIFKKSKPVPSLHKKLTWKEQVREFWLTNKGLFGLIIILVCISLLVGMLGFALSNGSYLGGLTGSEANHYQNLNRIVLFYGGGF